MEKEEKLVRVFTGSLVDAEYIKHILEENDIGALIKNAMKESLVAGWVSGTPDAAARVMVAEKNKEKALELVNEYMESDQKNSKNEED